MALIQKAGAIILGKINPALIVLLYRSKEKDWSFPKGHMENGESIMETSCREIMEETGLRAHIIDDRLPPMTYTNKDGDIVVHMLLMRSENDETITPEFEGDTIVWVPYTDVAEKLTYDTAKQYYGIVYKKIKQTINALQSKTH